MDKTDCLTPLCMHTWGNYLQGTHTLHDWCIAYAARSY